MIQTTLPLDCHQKWRMASRRLSIIEVAALATIVVSVVIIALVLFSTWAELEGRGALVPLLLAFPPHRFALWVLRLEPHLRRPAAIGRVHPRR